MYVCTLSSAEEIVTSNGRVPLAAPGGISRFTSLNSTSLAYCDLQLLCHHRYDTYAVEALAAEFRGEASRKS